MLFLYFLFRFIEITEYCSKETSEQACRDASTKNVVCHWCKVPSVCTSTFDQYTPIWLENDCEIAVMGEDNKGDSSSSTSNLNPTETTSTSPETSNQQLEATTIAVMGEDNKGDSSSSTSNLNPTETTTTSPETSKQQQEATTNAEMSEENKSNPSLSTSNSSPTQTTSTSPTTSKQEATRIAVMGEDNKGDSSSTRHHDDMHTLDSVSQIVACEDHCHLFPMITMYMSALLHIAVMGEDNKGDSSSSTSNLNPTETTSTSPEKTSNQQLEATTIAVMGEDNKGDHL
ncbi:hypothetical protein EWB00_001582 [Schistosoma japonicum]|uniref:Uncharacterized protein n=1 Tax=Schistosoma japonicum TaxID=6182 RepID=A0A4Z2DFC2_SCHJA|nr:hypothetical protein EWB00_001582 [Schistosoma japonicum]